MELQGSGLGPRTGGTHSPKVVLALYLDTDCTQPGRQNVLYFNSYMAFVFGGKHAKGRQGSRALLTVIVLSRRGDVLTVGRSQGASSRGTRRMY